MRRLVAAAALALSTLAFGSQASASHNRECRFLSAIRNDGFITARATCERIQRHNEMFFIQVELYRKSDGTIWRLDGNKVDCNGRVSRVTWIEGVYVWLDQNVIIWPDFKSAGC